MQSTTTKAGKVYNFAYDPVARLRAT